MHHAARTLITLALLVLASTCTNVAHADEPGWILQPTVELGAAYSSAVHVDRGEQMGVRGGLAVRLLSPIGVGIYARGLVAFSSRLRDPANETTPAPRECYVWCLSLPEGDMLTSIGGDIGVFYRGILLPGTDVELAGVVELGGSGVWIASSFESFGFHATAGVVGGALLELVVRPSQLTIAIGIDMRIMVPVDDALGGVWLGATPMLRIGRRYAL